MSCARTVVNTNASVNLSVIVTKPVVRAVTVVVRAVTVVVRAVTVVVRAVTVVVRAVVMNAVNLRPQTRVVVDEFMLCSRVNITGQYEQYW